MVGNWVNRKNLTKRSIAVKEIYEKPILTKHETLRDVTAGNSGDF
jgi:hypothetical protein